MRSEKKYSTSTYFGKNCQINILIVVSIYFNSRNIMFRQLVTKVASRSKVNICRCSILPNSCLLCLILYFCVRCPASMSSDLYIQIPLRHSTVLYMPISIHCIRQRMLLCEVYLNKFQHS